MRSSARASEEIDALWNFQDPEQSEGRFRELLDSIAQNDRDLRAEVETQIARALGLRGMFAEAQGVLEGIDVVSPDVSATVKFRHALELGRSLNSSGRPAEAIPHFERALELAASAGKSFYAVDAAHMLGIAHPGEQGLEWNLKTIQMIESATDERTKSWLGSLLNNTGWSLHDAGRFDEALVLFQKALAFRQEKGTQPGLRIAQWCVGRCLRSLGRIEEALAAQMSLLGQDDGDGYIPEEIGECLQALGRSEEARPFFAKAFEVLSMDTWMVANELGRLERLKQLASGSGNG